MITFETIKAECPMCGYRVDHATYAFAVPVESSESKAPQAGDISICFNCSAVNLFTDGFGNIRRPTYAELRKIASDERIQRAVRLIQEMWAERLINEVNKR